VPSVVPARPGEADGHKIWDKSYRSLCVHVSEKEGDAAEGEETGALPDMDIMPDGNDISSCFWGSSNVNGNDPRSLPARLLFVPVLGVPTRLRACADDAAVSDVRGWPRMSPSRSRCALIFILYACTASLSRIQSGRRGPHPRQLSCRRRQVRQMSPSSRCSSHFFSSETAGPAATPSRGRDGPLDVDGVSM
jgi:hypothetical protein